MRVCKDLISRRSLSYGYVNYSCLQGATRPSDMLNFTPLNNEPIRIIYFHRDSSIHKRELKAKEKIKPIVTFGRPPPFHCIRTLGDSTIVCIFKVILVTKQLGEKNWWLTSAAMSPAAKAMVVCLRKTQCFVYSS